MPWLFPHTMSNDFFYFDVPDPQIIFLLFLQLWFCQFFPPLTLGHCIEWHFVVSDATLVDSVLLSFTRVLHSASLFARAVVSCILVTAMVLTVLVSLSIMLTILRICVGIWRQDGHGQIPTVASFFNPTQSRWNHSAHKLHRIISIERPLRLPLCSLHCSVHIIDDPVVGSDAIGVTVDRSDESASIVAPSTGVPAGLPAIVQVGGVGVRLLCTQVFLSDKPRFSGRYL